MKDLYEKLDDNFNEISDLISGASIVNLSRVKERILEIVENKNLVHLIRQLEEKEDVIGTNRKPILLASVKEEEHGKLKEQIEKLEEENRQLKEQLLKPKANKVVGRKESLSNNKKEEIREIYKNGEMSMPKLAKKYRVSVGLIYKIIHS